MKRGERPAALKAARIFVKKARIVAKTMANEIRPVSKNCLMQWMSELTTIVR